MRVVELLSPLSPDECAARLLAAVDPEGLRPVPGSRPVIGRIAGHRVRLHKRLANENSFQTVLVGRLEPSHEGTAFRGRVGMHPGAVGCMAVYFAIAAIGSVSIAVSMAREGAGGGPIWAVVVPLLALMIGVIMVAGAAGMVWLGRVMARGEDEFLLTFVAEILNARRAVGAEPDTTAGPGPT